MFRQYIKQSLQMLKEAPLVSAVSIIGTALAMALVIVMIMLFQIKIASYKPEVNKKRTLTTAYIRSISQPDADGSNITGGVSFRLLNDHLYQMETPEIVAARGFIGKSSLSVASRRLLSEYDILATDVNFWKLYRFDFVEGQSYSPEEYESGLNVAVICQELAESLFLDQPAIGNTIYIDLKPHTVVGVVKDVSRAASNAYAQVWVPLSSNSAFLISNNGDTSGNILVDYLVREGNDEQTVIDEFNGTIKRFSDNSQLYTVTGKLNNYIEASFPSYRNTGGIKQYLKEGILLILFLLLLPAINLTGITINNIHKRSAEIGLRKTFGAMKTTLLWQILTENMVITAIGGVIGFALSFVFIHLGRDFLLTHDTLLTVDMLLRPVTFLAALFFCLVLNLLSAGLPAWRISRSPIVESINGNEH